MSAGFYKLEGSVVHYAPNRVFSPTVSLRKEDKDTYTYPQDGWYWFDTLEMAEAFFAGDIQETELLPLRLKMMDKAVREYIDIVAHWTAGPMVFDKASKGKPKASAIKTWVETCWGLYYQRLGQLEAGMVWDISYLDFSVVGPCPHSIKDAMLE